MNIEKYRSYCLSEKNVTASFYFRKLPNNQVIITTDKVKLSAENILERRAKHARLHRHDNKVISDNLKWIDFSYTLVMDSMTKKLKQYNNR